MDQTAGRQGSKAMDTRSVREKYAEELGETMLCPSCGLLLELEGRDPFNMVDRTHAIIDDLRNPTAEDRVSAARYRCPNSHVWWLLIEPD